MGYMRAHAIVIDSWNGEYIQIAHAKALEIFPWVSPLSPEATNGHRSFFIPPDGSKEGWEESDAGDGRRVLFKNWLRGQSYEDGSTCLRWAEVQFGDDNHESLVTDGDDNGQAGGPCDK